MPQPNVSLEDLTSDQLLATARQLQANSNLLTQLTSNPKTREMVQRAIKLANPDIVIPEIDAADSIRAELAAEREARLAAERKYEEDKIRERLEKEHAAVQAEFKLTDEQMTAVYKLMQDERLPSARIAARLYVAQTQPSVPTSRTIEPPVFSMPEKDIWGKGIGNKAALDKIATEQAYSALNEIRGGRMAGVGAQN